MPNYRIYYVRTTSDVGPVVAADSAQAAEALAWLRFEAGMAEFDYATQEIDRVEVFVEVTDEEETDA